MTFGEKALSDYSNLIWNSKSGLISCFSKKLQSWGSRGVGSFWLSNWLSCEEKPFFYRASFSGFFPPPSELEEHLNLLFISRQEKNVFKDLSSVIARSYRGELRNARVPLSQLHWVKMKKFSRHMISPDCYINSIQLTPVDQWELAMTASDWRLIKR